MHLLRRHFASSRNTFVTVIGTPRGLGRRSSYLPRHTFYLSLVVVTRRAPTHIPFLRVGLPNHIHNLHRSHHRSVPLHPPIHPCGSIPRSRRRLPQALARTKHVRTATVPMLPTAHSRSVTLPIPLLSLSHLTTTRSPKAITTRRLLRLMSRRTCHHATESTWSFRLTPALARWHRVEIVVGRRRPERPLARVRRLELPDTPGTYLAADYSTVISCLTLLILLHHSAGRISLELCTRSFSDPSPLNAFSLFGTYAIPLSLYSI